MSWDDDNAEWDAPAKDEKVDAVPVITDAWDGEDEDEDTLLGDDWDAEPKTEEEKKAPVSTRPKALTKRQIGKKREEEERAAAEKRLAMQKEIEVDPDALNKQKEAEKRAIEQSNLGLVGDLFGGDGYEAPEGGEFQNDQLDADNSDMIGGLTAKELSKMKVKTDEPLDDVELKTAEDFKKFAKRVSKLVTDAGKGSKSKERFLATFLKDLLTESMKPMKLDDCTDLKKQINVTCNQKAKDEQGKKKKAGTKKAALSMGGGKGKANSAYDDDGYGDDGLDGLF